MKKKVSASLEKLWRRYHGLCWLCGLAVPLAEATRDHKVPKSRGGSNRIDNIALAHRACNELRGNDIAAIFVTPRPTNPARPPRLTTDERIRLQKREES